MRIERRIVPLDELHASETEIVIARLLSQAKRRSMPASCARVALPCPSPTKYTARANKKSPQPSASRRGGRAACFSGVARGSMALRSVRRRGTLACERVSGNGQDCRGEETRGGGATR
jgi:hypothetical protein